jgi:hypothetical protein
MQFSLENKGVVTQRRSQLKCPLSASDQIEGQAERLRYRTNGGLEIWSNSLGGEPMRLMGSRVGHRLSRAVPSLAPSAMTPA